MTERPGPRTEPAFWEQRYVDGDMPWDTGQADIHLVELWGRLDIPAGPALDVGCGTGTNALWLASQGREVVGVDLSQTAIEQAQKRAAASQHPCRFEVANLLEQEIDGGPFALVYDRGCFHIFSEVEDREAFAGSVARHLSPGGIWISLMGSTDGPPRDTGPPRRSATEALAAVEPHFELLELRSVAFDDADHKHARAWSMVARRRG